MHGSPSVHHHILGSVLTFKCDDLFLYLNIFILSSVLTFKCDDLFLLKYLCMSPLYYTTISLVQFQHSSMMPFLQ